MTKMLALAALLLLGGLRPATVPAQDAGVEVRDVLAQLFDGMRAGDSTAVRALFHEEARLATAALRDGRPTLRAASVDAFVEAVGTPHDAVWDERVWDVEVRVDGVLASAWMRYAFYLGDRLHHCGVNTVDLFRSDDGWRIIHLADTHGAEGCTPPP